MKKNKTFVYKFRINEGEYEITEKAEDQMGLLSNIERILGKVVVKGRNELFEIIEIKSRQFPSVNGVYLTERKNITYEYVKRFINFHSNGDRSVLHYPYTDDLKDDTLLSDLGISVLTYKHYYATDDYLADVYYVCRVEDANEDLKKRLDEVTTEAICQSKKVRAWRKADEDKSLIWEDIR